MDLGPEAALARAEQAGEDIEPYTRHLFLGVQEYRDELDRALGSSLEGWTVSRLAPVERNVLRLGLFELLYVEDMAPAVVINEAVELTKRFASNEAAALVNGVLGALSKGEAKP
jgi:N utilization substance protein B